MNFLGTPDFLSNMRMARTVSSVQTNLNRASQELTSGLKSDLVKATGGDPARLYAIERDLTLNEGRAQVIDFAIGRVSTIQTAMDHLQEAVGSVGAQLAGAVTIGDPVSSQLYADRARGGFEAAVTALNTRYGDRSLFAGAATDGQAVASADDILAEIKARVATATNATDAIAAVDNYFNDPAGFDATGYLGSTTNASSSEISAGERVDYAIRADRAEIKNMLRALAIGVIGAEGGYTGDDIQSRMELMAESARRGLSTGEDLVRLRGETGFSEERLDMAKTRTAAENNFLQQARNTIKQKDPYEAAMEFTAVQTQLETIFSVTARLSDLHLTNYLR